MIAVGTSIYPNIMTKPPDLDPHEADRKYAAIAIACVLFMKNRARSVVARESVFDWIEQRAGDFDFDEFDKTIKWLEDNAQ